MRRKNCSETNCPICKSTDITVLLEIRQIPAHCNVLCPSKTKAYNVSRGDIRLGFCGFCGHIFNLLYDPDSLDYDSRYENSLDFSPTFQNYIKSIAQRLIDNYGIRSKDIIEIGCGRGEFLKMLCEGGDNHGVGFDPGYVGESSDQRLAGNLTFIKDYYSDCYGYYKSDLICCRHVLEHIYDPGDFLNLVRKAARLGTNSIVFFEVPYALFTLRDLSIWDIIYEHYSYFTCSSMARLFRTCGFEVFDIYDSFEGQFLCLEASPGDVTNHVGIPNCYDLKEASNLISNFNNKYHRKLEIWHNKLAKFISENFKILLWGAGSKGVSFLNTLNIKSEIEYVVDINPRKHFKFIPGTGQQVVPPKFLQDYQPDVVILMNTIYKSEVELFLKEAGLRPSLEFA